MGIKVRKNNQWVTVATASLGTGTTKVAQLWDQKTAGTDGGTFTAGSWVDRTLNTENDPQSFVTLESGNVSFSLLSGTYRITWSAPANNVHLQKTRLVHSSNSDFSAPVTTIQGSSGFDSSNMDPNSQTRSFGDTQLTINAKTYFKIQHRCTVTQNTYGFGGATGLAAEIYTQVTIEDLNTAAGAGGGGGDITDGDKGDITVTNSGATWTIDNDVIEEKHINAGGTAANNKILQYDSTHATNWSWTDPGATVTTSDSAPSSPSDGDLWWNSATGILNVYYADTNSSQWVNATGRAGGGSTSGITKIATVKDIKAYNENGGSFTADTWLHRNLNTVSDPQSIGLTVSANVVTVPAGTYSLRWRAPGYNCNRFTSRLVYSTSSTFASDVNYVIGSSGYSQKEGENPDVSETFGVAASLTFSATTYVKVEQYSDAGESGDTGLGVDSGISGTDSIYTTLVIEDLATAVKEPTTSNNIWNVVKTDTQSIDNETWTDVSGLSQSVTSSTASTKFLITATVNCGMSAATHDGLLRLMRGTTVIGSTSSHGSTTANNTGFGQVGGQTGYYNAEPLSITYLDTPGVGSHTYHIEGLNVNNASNLLVNTRGAGGFYTTSHMSIQQIS